MLKIFNNDKNTVSRSASLADVYMYFSSVSIQLVLYNLLAMTISLLLIQSTWKVALLAIAALLTVILAWLKPEYILYMLFSAVIIMTDAITEELTDVGGIFLVEDIKIMVGIPPVLISVLLMLFALYFTKFSILQKQTSAIPFKYLFVYMGVLLIETLYSVQSGIAFDDNLKMDLLRFVYPALCFYLCINILNNTKVIHRMIWVIFVACFIKTGLLDLYYMAGHGWPFGDFQIVTQDSATLMIAGIMISMVLLIVAIRYQHKFLTLMVIASLPMAFALIFSFRRAHWIGQILSFALIYFWSHVRIRKKIVSFLGVSFILSAIIVMSINSSAGLQTLSNVANRFSTLIDPTQHSNLHHYIEAKQTIKDILKKPIFGLGLGSEHSPVSETFVDWPEENQPLHVVHNTFIYLWMKLGLPGLILFSWAGLRYLKMLRNYCERSKHGNSWPYISGIGSGIGIWLAMFLTGPVPWYLHQTFLIALFSALAINMIRLDIDELKSQGTNFGD